MYYTTYLPRNLVLKTRAIYLLEFGHTYTETHRNTVARATDYSYAPFTAGMDVIKKN